MDELLHQLNEDVASILESIKKIRGNFDNILELLVNPKISPNPAYSPTIREKSSPDCVVKTLKNSVPLLKPVKTLPSCSNSITDDVIIDDPEQLVMEATQISFDLDVQCGNPVDKINKPIDENFSTVERRCDDKNFNKKADEKLNLHISSAESSTETNSSFSTDIIDEPLPKMPKLDRIAILVDDVIRKMSSEVDASKDDGKSSTEMIENQVNMVNFHFLCLRLVLPLLSLRDVSEHSMILF